MTRLIDLISYLFMSMPLYNKKSLPKLVTLYMLPWIGANIFLDLLMNASYYVMPDSYYAKDIMYLILIAGKGALIGVFLSKFFLERDIEEQVSVSPE
ncbi:MAG: hypothetical protein GY756_13200 [bacterium]|nr:hypothetical protein [bacterium]